MDKTQQTIRYLTRNEIVENNRGTITDHGGLCSQDDTIPNIGSLEYLVSFVKGDVGDYESDRSVERAAATYAYHIITRHIFFDGNKRTGLISALVFLTVNGIEHRELTEEEIICVSKRISRNEINLDELTDWFRSILKTELP